MRIAWIGPAPSADGGATYVGTQLLRGLAREGSEVDCFVGARRDQLPPALLDEPGLEFVLRPPSWEWGRWYSRTRLGSVWSGQLARIRAQWDLAAEIAARHEKQPYDVVYQFSQSEAAPLRRLRRRLPPIVVHPSTHAAGELASYRREADLARRCEPVWRRAAVQGMWGFRAAVQRRELPKADRVLAVSRRFAEHLAEDYRIAPERLGVVPNPIDLERFQVGEPRARGEPHTLLFVSRISVRKGVDQVVGLSHRLADLEGKVRIAVVGGPTMWSDYRPLLSDLNAGIAGFYGPRGPDELKRAYQGAIAVLQPSTYEPFALTVGEALASGTPVVASDEVGAIDGIDRAVCSVFPAGDLDAFEAAVREIVVRASGPDRPRLSALARAEAERLFAPRTVTATLLDELGKAAGGARR